jgi:diadenosine tetraphosphatase ApaH/serine/threonine PP2A family protein phosphatase
VALQAVYWTRDQLERGGSPSIINKRWDFLGELPPSYRDGDFLYVHGSPREPTNEYVFPEDVYNHRKLDSLFERIEKYCFQGHTHIPGIFTEDRKFISPEECDYRYPLGEAKVMINVGSVGQPRDGNPNACYVVLDDEEKTVTFRRVQYPKETTRDKIYAIAELDNMLGDRLMTGR